MSDDEPTFARRQSFAAAWADLAKAARVRVITLIAQLAFLALAVVGYFTASNGEISVLTVIGVAGVIAMVVVRLVMSVGRIAGRDPLRNRLLDE